MDLIIREDLDGVCRLTLNAPARLNALSDAMIAALHDTLNDIADDNSIRAVIIKGTGKAFCAGHDLKEMQAKRDAPDNGAAALKDLFDRCAAMMARIQSLPQPVIAQVHGIATAAGCQLVATCDLAIAADDTRFGVNGVNIGLFCSTPMVALTRNNPPQGRVRDADNRPLHPRSRSRDTGPYQSRHTHGGTGRGYARSGPNNRRQIGKCREDG